MLDKGPVTAVGAMSGTSLDGVDAAQIVTDGHRVVDFGPVAYRAYSVDEQAVLRAGLGLWPADGVDDVAALVDRVHQQVLADFPQAELIGFHGQTLAHDPAGGRTHQCGDGAVLAQTLGKPVIWDFRSADMHMGGQGAPLAPFYHFALAKWMQADAPLAFLNLGGVGNITWIDPVQPAPETAGALLAFDTGPANAPLNDLMQQRTGKAYDADGALAASGTVNEDVISDFLAHRFFARIPPKSLDRDDFAGLGAAVASLSDEDAAATLTAAAARSVAAGLQHCPVMPARVLVTGGGRRNPTMMAMLADAMTCPVVAVEDVGLDGDMLEAQAFAYLAVRVARGLPTSCEGTTGMRAAVSGGTISRPA